MDAREDVLEVEDMPEVPEVVASDNLVGGHLELVEVAMEKMSWSASVEGQVAGQGLIR